MNFGMIDALVGSHTSDIRRQVASRRAAARGRPGLRSRIGFALVEAGLCLQVTARPLGQRSQAAE